MKRKIVAVSAIAAVATLSACAGPRPEEQTTTLQFEGSVIIPTGKSFLRCVQGGEKGPHDFGGTNRTYPGNQRVVEFSPAKGADRGAIRVLSKDGVELDVPGQLQYTLNTDCGDGEGDDAESSPIVEFDKTIGRRYGASFDDGPDKIPSGWRDVQRIYLETPLETAMDRAAQNYAWRDLVFNPQTKAQWEKDVVASLPGLVDRGTPGEAQFYLGLQPLFGVPTLVGEAGQAAQTAIVDGQRRVAEAQAREAEAAANQKAAQAQIAVAQAEAKKRQAEIAGYGSVAEYNRAKAIEKGINPYQPTYGGVPVATP